MERGLLPDGSFIQPAPHVTFVHGESEIEWLRKRVAKLKTLPSFAATEISEDYDQIKKWVPLLCSGRPRDGEPIACSRHRSLVHVALLHTLACMICRESGS